MMKETTFEFTIHTYFYIVSFLHVHIYILREQLVALLKESFAKFIRG